MGEPTTKTNAGPGSLRARGLHVAVSFEDVASRPGTVAPPELGLHRGVGGGTNPPVPLADRTEPAAGFG